MSKGENRPIPASEWPKSCSIDGVITHKYKNNSICYLLAASTKSWLRGALRFVKLVVLGAIFFVVPARAATIETMASLPAPLPLLDQASHAFPQVRLSDGSFYGTVFGGFNGGGSDHGSVFKLEPNGSLNTLYLFQAVTEDEANPTFLIAGTDGNSVRRDSAQGRRRPERDDLQADAVRNVHSGSITFTMAREPTPPV